MRIDSADHINFATLLQRAVNEPGRVHEAYSAFHNYSIGNQLLALGQCALRGILPGPIATFPRWKSRGRSLPAKIGETLYPSEISVQGGEMNH
jgi:hypothetical protein